MKPLILDCHAQLPLWRRLGQGAVNALGWVWWVYMWLPLLGLLLQYLVLDAEAEPCPDGEVPPLVETMYLHGFVFAGWGGLLFAWSVLQWYEKEWHASTRQRLVTTRQLAQSIRLSEDGLDAWQRTQRIVVCHDENSGWICGAFCADSLLSVDDLAHSQRKRFIILYGDHEPSCAAEDALASADGGAASSADPGESIGSSTVNRVPVPGALSTRMDPRCMSTI
jgi:poly-beta-1,6-N-acetyl-D-glucosamine biosynthesis protein PgaD